MTYGASIDEDVRTMFNLHFISTSSTKDMRTLQINIVKKV